MYQRSLPQNDLRLEEELSKVRQLLSSEQQQQHRGSSGSNFGTWFSVVQSLPPSVPQSAAQASDAALVMRRDFFGGSITSTLPQPLLFSTAAHENFGGPYMSGHLCGNEMPDYMKARPSRGLQVLCVCIDLFSEARAHSRA